MTKKIMILLLLFLLTGCRVKDENIPENIPDTISPNFYGVEDIEIDKADQFSPLEGVTAYDVQDGYLTESITFEGIVDILEYGTYLVKYRVTDSDGHETLVLRYVTIVPPPNELVSIFPYGDFFDGLEGFDIYQETWGGYANFNVNGGVLEVELLAVEEGIVLD